KLGAPQLARHGDRHGAGLETRLRGDLRVLDVLIEVEERPGQQRKLVGGRDKAGVPRSESKHISFYRPHITGVEPITGAHAGAGTEFFAKVATAKKGDSSRLPEAALRGNGAGGEQDGQVLVAHG